jgi:hypothetical protein
MDASESKPPKRPLIARLVVGALVALLVLGMWQGYGSWLLGQAGAHGS